MTFFIKTYGCQMNVRDSEAVAAQLLAAGHELADSEQHADLVIVNTCSVRQKAEDKALGKLGLLVAAAGDRSPRRRVGVIGCMVQRLGIAIFERVPGLDFAIGTRRLSTVARVVARVKGGEGPILDADPDPVDEEEPVGHVPGAVTRFVNILYGCDRRCSYCIVPDVRGHERSRPAEDVLSEIRSLVADGVSEVTLLGQSVMQYGRRNPAWAAPPGPGEPCEPLPRLLHATNGIDGLRRVRFTTGHPSGCTEELAKVMAEAPRVCPHLHLPLQSGSDRVLARMRRGYTTAEYRAAVARLRSAVPGIAITTDVIVGFPAERIEDFEDTRRFLNEMGFDNAFIFKYSPRPNTAAAAWTDDVPAEEKLRRNKVLLAEQDRRSEKINGALVGREVEILVEGVSQRNVNRWSGRTGTNKITVFEPRAGLRPGDPAAVRIERVTAQTLYGALCRGTR